MPKVNIAEKGISINFPDDMSQEEITKAIDDLWDSMPAAPFSPFHTPELTLGVILIGIVVAILAVRYFLSRKAAAFLASILACITMIALCVFPPCVRGTSRLFDGRHFLFAKEIGSRYVVDFQILALENFIVIVIYTALMLVAVMPLKTQKA